MMKNNLYFRNISRRWKKEANKSDELVFFSPYITSSTAETVLLVDGGPACTIYTCFKAENFACRASSLKTLKKLFRNDCKLFHIENLHAKVMLSDDFVSIGSQNLTNKGKTNLEASFCSDDTDFLQYSHNAVEDWVSLAEEITLAMIEDMEDEIAPLIIEYDKIKKLFNAADDTVIEKENARQRVEVNRIKKMLESEERLKKLAANARNITQSSNSILANVDQLTNQGVFGDETYTSSLIPWKGKGSFLSWRVGKKTIELDKQTRYLVMDTKSGRVSWARVNKGRITYFSDAVSISEETSIGHWRCTLEFKSNWSDTESRHNLTISIKYSGTDIKLVYECHFDLKFLTEICLNKEESQNYVGAEEIILWNEKHIKEFSDSIAHHILSPFLYKKKLLGKQAEDFFIYPSQWRKVSLGMIKNFPILLSQFHR
ncbi:MAG: hypothetical protein ACI8XG_001850 [Congregibacter sp.]|jgi:hypothetical protein